MHLQLPAVRLGQLAERSLPVVEVVNDFAALAASLPLLGPDDLRPVGGAAPAPDGTAPLAVLGPGDTVTVNGAVHQESRTPALDVVILGGLPIREPIAM